MSHLLRLESISFSYRPADPEPAMALGGIDLVVEPGEYVAIIGHNGSGKSTLARHLNGLLLPTRGEVWVNGWNTRDAGRRRDIRSTVGMVFQVPDNQIIATTVEDDVAFGPENLGVPEAELRERVDAALKTVGLWEERKRLPHQLSAGQKQRLAIAGVMAMQPRCLVLDEATALLDPQGRADVLAALRRLHGAGTTIIAITHRMAEAAEAGRVLVLDRGQIALQGTPREVFARTEALEALGLDVPPVAALAAALHEGHPDFPATLLTVAELADAVAARWPNDSAEVAPCPLLSAGDSALPWTPVPPSPTKGEARGEPLIRARGLEHTYMPGTPLAVPALRGVDLEVWAGEAIGIIGPAGAGKSTLVQHLNGLLRPGAPGRLWIDGQDMGDPRVDARPIRRRTGLIFQRPEDQLFEPLVGDDIAFGPRKMGLPRAEVRERVRRAMEMVGLDFGAFVDRPIMGLSGGERRRVAMAGVLALEPSTLILDEATSGLDPQGRRELLALLARLNREQGKTVILVASYMEDLVGLVERVVILDGGRTVLQGALREVLAQAELLRSHGLGVPQVAEVAAALAARGCRLARAPLTVAEAAEAIAPRLEVSYGVV